MTDQAAQNGKAAHGKVRTGVVTSAAGDKTIHVVVQNLVKHPVVGKYIRRKTKLAVHDPDNQAGVGDLVEVVSCRRLSKSKAFRLVRVVRTSALGQIES